MDVLDTIRRPSARGRVGMGVAAVAAVGTTLAVAPAPAGAESYTDCSGSSTVSSSYQPADGIYYNPNPKTKTSSCLDIYVQSNNCHSFRIRFPNGTVSNWVGSCGSWVRVASNVISGTKFVVQTEATAVGYVRY